MIAVMLEAGAAVLMLENRGNNCRFEGFCGVFGASGLTKSSLGDVRACMGVVQLEVDTNHIYMFRQKIMAYAHLSAHIGGWE